MAIAESYSLSLLLLAIGLLHVSNAAVDKNVHRAFADSLTAKLYKDENEFSSALGVSMAFSLIYPGSNGDSTEEIRNVLGYPSGSQLQLVWNETSVALDNAYEGQCEVLSYDGETCEQQAPLLKIAYSVWMDDNATLAPDYKAVVGDYAIQIDFEAENSSNQVNAWVENQTNGLIDAIVPKDRPLFPPWILLAINSIYLKASWLSSFTKALTSQDVFYSSVSRETQVSEAHFMHKVSDNLQYSHDALPGFQIASLPFAASTMSFVIVLPTSEDSVAVTSTELLPELSNLENTRVALALPKFKFESEYDLNDVLKDVGIVAPFSGDLCGIFGDCGPFVDKVIQKTVVDVNEEGVEAAAVTLIAVSESAQIYTDEPVLMMADHPFQFFIVDHSEELVIFEGRLGAPEIPEGTVSTLLESKHSDGAFWSKNFNVNPVDPVMDSSSHAGWRLWFALCFAALPGILFLQ